ncbi:MAG: DUF4149 domain-containing protein [Pseudomonadota bacterium]
MRRFTESLYAISITLWIGGLWIVGFLVAPTLFSQVPERTLAGMLAGKLFNAMSWIGLSCATYLLLFTLLRQGAAACKSSVFWLVFSLLALTALSLFGITPIIAQLKAGTVSHEWVTDLMSSITRDRFAVWHGIASVLYVLQSVLGLLLVVTTGRRQRF